MDVAPRIRSQGIVAGKLIGPGFLSLLRQWSFHMLLFSAYSPMYPLILFNFLQWLAHKRSGKNVNVQGWLWTLGSDNEEYWFLVTGEDTLTVWRGGDHQYTIYFHVEVKRSITTWIMSHYAPHLSVYIYSQAKSWEDSLMHIDMQELYHVRSVTHFPGKEIKEIYFQFFLIFFQRKSR